MSKKFLTVGIIVLFIFCNISLSIVGMKINTRLADDENNVIYVNKLNIFGPWDGSKWHPFKTIQEGINAASNGNTVFVHRGRYHEKIVINKSIRLIGADKRFTILDANNKYDLIKVYSDFVEIQGFTFQNAFLNTDNWKPLFCIYLDSGEVGNISIHDNIIKNNLFGLLYGDCHYVKIYNNVFKNNLNGLMTGDINFNEIHNNTFINCGILIDGFIGEGTYFDNNIVNGKPWIYLINEENMIIENAGQVTLVDCSNITLRNLDIQSFDYCLFLDSCDNCSIIGCKFSNSAVGILLMDCENTQIDNNEISFVISGIISQGSKKKFSITNNFISWAFIGMGVDWSTFGYPENKNIISNNKIKNTLWIGIYLNNFCHCNISNNLISASPIFRFLADYFPDFSLDYFYMRGGLPNEGPYGIFICDRARNNTIIHNTISGQNRSLIFASASNNQVLENNFLSNTVDAFFYDSNNYWNGNYWNEPISGPKAIEGYSGDELVYEYDYNPAQEPWGDIGGLNKCSSIFNLPFEELSDLFDLWNIYKCSFPLFDLDSYQIKMPKLIFPNSNYTEPFNTMYSKS